MTVSRHVASMHDGFTFDRRALAALAMPLLFATGAEAQTAPRLAVDQVAAACTSVAERASAQPDVLDRRTVTPVKTVHVDPTYPPLALLARIQGDVFLVATIGTDGRVESAEICAGVPMLDTAAVEAVKQWVYEPTVVDGRPHRAVAMVSAHFGAR